MDEIKYPQSTPSKQGVLLGINYPLNLTKKLHTEMRAVERTTFPIWALHGSGDIYNLIAQNRHINRSGGEWYNMEQEWANALGGNPPKK